MQYIQYTTRFKHNHSFAMSYKILIQHETTLSCDSHPKLQRNIVLQIKIMFYLIVKTLGETAEQHEMKYELHL